MAASTEQNLVTAIAQQFRATSRQHGALHRGGHHQLKLRGQAPDLKSVKQKMRLAFKAAGYRAQQGAFGTNMNSPDALEFYAIRGNYDYGIKACITLEGTADKPEMSITFGG